MGTQSRKESHFDEYFKGKTPNSPTIDSNFQTYWKTEGHSIPGMGIAPGIPFAMRNKTLNKNNFFKKTLFQALM